MKNIHQIIETFFSRYNHQQKQKIDLYITLLYKWGKVYNLTSSYKNNQILPHLLDSVYLAIYLQKSPFTNIADIGSGAGFPVIISAILNPNKNFTSFEIDINKSTFLRQVILECSLTNINIYGDFKKVLNKNKFEVVTSKAFLTVNEFIKIYYRLVSPAGIGIVFLNQKQLFYLNSHLNKQSLSNKSFDNTNIDEFMLISQFLIPPSSMSCAFDGEVVQKNNLDNDKNFTSFVVIN